jgi:hypothetical protein
MQPTVKPVDTTSPLRVRLGTNALLAALRECIAAPGVAAEVTKNYSDNLWWPVDMPDWRKRMLIAGWSTRVSYAHIQHYQNVTSNVRSMTWNEIVALSDDELVGLVRPIGLPSARITYLRSLAPYLDGISECDYLRRDNTPLIEEFAHAVNGAGYKVAQCAVLYTKGYHCGIIPIDSGMVAMLAPIVPDRLPSGAAAHEVVRRWIEALVAEVQSEIRTVAATAGFRDLIAEGLPTWWVHLVLIYYKRLYWNRAKLGGPFRKQVLNDESIAVATDHVDIQSFPGVLIEGIDGAGKTYFADLLRAAGYRYAHSPHQPDGDVYNRYKAMLEGLSAPAVLDRSFVSEYVYGRVLRGGSRISLEECNELLRMLAARRFVAFHLEEAEELLAVRREESADVRRSLILEYREFFARAREILPVYSLRPSQLAPGFLVNFLCDSRVRPT